MTGIRNNGTKTPKQNVKKKHNYYKSVASKVAAATPDAHVGKGKHTKTPEFPKAPNSELPVAATKEQGKVFTRKQNKQPAQKPIKNSKYTQSVKIIPLGGLHEIGKNITLFEYNNEILIIDCGIAFPEEDLLGIDLVIPDFGYLVRNKDRIKGLVLTHGHEDHIGSIVYLLREVNIPIYGTRLTMGLLGNKLKEHGLIAECSNVSAGETIKIGSFDIEFVRTNHSIADSVAIVLKTPFGNIVHSGDFKIDYTPIQGDVIDLQRFAEIGKEGVLLFLCESTNVLQPGYTISERRVGKIVHQIFEDSPSQRILVATFSSNIHRIQQIIDSAILTKRKLIVMGRSMVNAVNTASELGYLNIPDNLLIDVSEVAKYNDDEIVILTTGSQGETMAALSRMALDSHNQIHIKPNDKVIISASPIPGNEKMVSRVIDGLMKKGADVIYNDLMDVHVSGHAKQEEIKIMHALLKPKYVMPVHGEFRHMKAHRDLLVDMGFNKDNVYLMALGEVLEVNDKEAKVTGKVQSGRVFVDGLGVGDVGNVVIRDRRLLSEDGLVIVVVGIDMDERVVLSGPDIISRGFVYVKESEELMTKAKQAVVDALDSCDQQSLGDWNYVKNLIRDTLKDYIWKQTKRSPMIIPIVTEV